MDDTNPYTTLYTASYANPLSVDSNVQTSSRNVNTSLTKHNTYLNFGYFLIGLIIGMIILIIIVTILYATRVLWFSDCKIDNSTCTRQDYYNSPEIALQNGENVNGNLFLNNIDGTSTTGLFFRRIQKGEGCTPGPNQSILVPFPQQCMLTTNGNNQMVYRRTARPDDKSLTLEYSNTNLASLVDLGPNCTPSPTSGFTSGVPIPRWDLGV